MANKPKFVVIESPHASKNLITLAQNIAYVRAAMRDCFRRGEAPFASHALYTLPGVLDDNDPDQRLQGMQAGFDIGELIARAGGIRAFYVDRGVSNGMKLGEEKAAELKQDTEYRRLLEEE